MGEMQQVKTGGFSGSITGGDPNPAEPAPRRNPRPNAMQRPLAPASRTAFSVRRQVPWHVERRAVWCLQSWSQPVAGIPVAEKMDLFAGCRQTGKTMGQPLDCLLDAAEDTAGKPRINADVEWRLLRVHISQAKVSVVVHGRRCAKAGCGLCFLR